MQLQFDLPPAGLAGVRRILTSDIDISVKPRPHKKSFVFRTLESSPKWWAFSYVSTATVILILQSLLHFNLVWIQAVGVLGLIIVALALALSVAEVLLSSRRWGATQQIDREIKRRSSDTDDADSVKAAVLESEAAREGGED